MRIIYKTFSLVLSVAILITFTASLVNAAEVSVLKKYSVDSQKSQFFVNTGSAGFLSALGHKHKISVSNFSGEVAFDPKDISKSSVQLKINPLALSLIPDSKKAEKDKAEIETNMRDKVLEVSQFPEITFRSTSVLATPVNANEFDAEIHGVLSLHGTNQDIILKTKIVLSSNSLVASGKFTLKQTDYKIRPATAAGGAIKVKDEVELSFEIAAH